MTFSERFGFVVPKSVVQAEGADQDLRTGIWNILIWVWLGRLPSLLDEGSDDEERNAAEFSAEVWVEFFKRPIDEIPIRRDWFQGEVKRWYWNCQWYKLYDLLEFVAQRYPSATSRELLQRKANRVLVKELSGYRLVGGRIVSITSPEEVREVEEVVALADRFAPVSEHLANALSLFADREAPDYRNSVKESISAVEAVCNILVGEKTSFGKALKKIRVPDHGGFQAGMAKLYGYASDAEGIRHALLEKSEIDQADARYFLVICSAFVNYLIARSAKED